MRIDRLINALKKIGVEIKMNQREIYDHFEGKYVLSTPEYFGDNGKNKIHFYGQDERAICCQVMGVRQDNDSQSDYFPGFFARSIKDAIRGMVQ